jgi:hypothetical protein
VFKVEVTPIQLEIKRVKNHIRALELTIGLAIHAGVTGKAVQEAKEQLGYCEGILEGIDRTKRLGVK